MNGAQWFARAAFARRVGAVILTAAMCFGLAACGGGDGGGGSVAPTAQPDPTPPATPPQRPIVIDPNGTSGGIPNRLISAAGSGTEDPLYTSGCISGGSDGQCFSDNQGRAAEAENADFRRYSDGAQFGHRRIQGGTDNPRLEVRLPPQDVRAAWRDGWTGRGVNILVIDNFGGNEVTEQNRLQEYVLRTRHGYAVAMAAKQIAGRARIYFLDRGGTLGRRYGAFGNNDDEPLRVERETPVQVINLSFGPRLLEDDNGRPRPPTEAEARNYRQFGNGSRWSSLYSDLRSLCPPPDPCLFGGYRLGKTEDAVIVHAAGNNGVDANWDLMSIAFLSEEQFASRVLIVGALTHFARASTANEPAQVSTTAALAGYSNFAGRRREMQERFLVEYADLPWRTAYLCQNDDTPHTCDIEQPFAFVGGTSYAAPRVAGYAALVRQKFPDLSAPQTTKILLDTATYEGLACHPNCRPDIYGQGRVDITDALSPIGKLE